MRGEIIYIDNIKNILNWLTYYCFFVFLCLMQKYQENASFFSFFIDVYHATFHPPNKVDVVKRLKIDPNSTEPIMLKRLGEYHRFIVYHKFIFRII